MLITTWLDVIKWRIQHPSNAGKPSIRQNKLPRSTRYSQRWLTKEKQRINRFSRRKVKQLLHIGEDPSSMQFGINPWHLS
jgi:hypothetical protein